MNNATPVLKTTWASELTGFFSPLLSQTYLRRTGGICAPEPARGRQISAITTYQCACSSLFRRIGKHETWALRITNFDAPQAGGGLVLSDLARDHFPQRVYLAGRSPPETDCRHQAMQQ